MGWREERRLGVIGVTGTSGKTTTCHLVEAILADGRPPAALASSEVQRIGTRAVTISQPSTPSLAIGHFLAEAAEAGAPWAVVELEATDHAPASPAHSSTGPVADRLDPTEIDILVVTTVTPADADSVASLVRALSPECEGERPRALLLNRDEPAVMQLAEGRHLPLLTFGRHPDADIRATAVETSLEGAKFRLHLPGAEPEPCHLQLLGEQNVQNALAASAVGHVLGLSPATIARALFRCPGLPGRMEQIEEGQRSHVVRDLADTPERLAQVARFRPPGVERVCILSGGGLRKSFRAALAEAEHGELLLLLGPPDLGFDPRSLIRDVLR